MHVNHPPPGPTIRPFKGWVAGVQTPRNQILEREREAGWSKVKAKSQKKHVCLILRVDEQDSRNHFFPP